MHLYIFIYIWIYIHICILCIYASGVGWNDWGDAGLSEHEKKLTYPEECAVQGILIVIDKK
jgi:hypothetical protein